MATGQNFKRISGTNSDISKIYEKIENAKDNYMAHLKGKGYHDEKAMKLKKAIEILEYELYYLEEMDRIRRNWK